MMLLALVLACLPAAPPGVDDGAGDTATDPCDAYTWETVGGPFMLTWCAPCHAAALPAPRRQGAPADVNLHTEQATLSHGPRVLARATGPAASMPPRGGPSDDDRERLATWIQCVLSEPGA